MDQALDTCAAEQSAGAAILLFQTLILSLRQDECKISPSSKWSPDAAPEILATRDLGGKLPAHGHLDICIENGVTKFVIRFSFRRNARI